MLFLSACGGASPDRSGNLTSADEVLTAAREAVNSVISYRLESSQIAKAFSGADSQSMSVEVTLRWSAPDRFHFRAEGFNNEGKAGQVEYIGADGRVFSKESNTGDVWTDVFSDEQSAKGALARAESYYNTFSKAKDFVPAMDETELVGKEVIDGLTVYHIKGTSSIRVEPPDELPTDAADDHQRQQTDSIYDLYINTGDFFPRRLVTVADITWETSQGDSSGTGPLHTEKTEDFLDFNIPVTIEFPEVR